MSREVFIAEAERRLFTIFSASWEGYKSSADTRHHLEGFIQAGVFLGVVTNAEMRQLMEDVHYSVFGKTIKERNESRPITLQDEDIDYSRYDPPISHRK